MTKKGHYPKRGTNCPKLVFPVFQVEIRRNHMYSPNFKRNGRKLLHLWPTALSGTQNCPFPIGPFGTKIRNLGPYHLLDVITKEKPAKFQIKWTTASKVMRHRNFCTPKRVNPPKGVQIGPKLKFSVFQVEIPWNHVYSPNLKRNGWKLLQLWPTALSGTQNCPFPIGPFRRKIRNLGPYHLLDIITKEKPAKFQTKWTLASKVMRPRNFLGPKKGQPPKTGTNWLQIEILCFPSGDTLKSCVQSKFQAKRLKIAPVMTDRTFWDPQLPHFHRPLFEQKLEICTLSHFRHCYAKRACKIASLCKAQHPDLQLWDLVIFVPRKRVNTPKWPKSVPNGIF